ncbi:MAG: hypothetical protein AAF266_15035 [Planctomycetota bacterium]
MRWTEKQIEDYLKSETRSVTGRDGVRYTVTMFRTYWITYDAVRVDDLLTEDELVDSADRRARIEGLCFAEALQRQLTIVDRAMRG